jgi:molybdate transport system substrate-binding protein
MRLTAFMGTALLASQVASAELKVLSTNALTSVIGELQPEFERSSGQRVKVEFKPTNILLERIRGGEGADLIIVGRQALLELEKEGKIAAGTHADLAQSSVALAIRAGLPRPDISTEEAFKRTLLGARAIAASRVGLSGLHFAKVLEKLGIAETVKPRIHLVDGGGRTGDLIVKGEVDMAVQLVSELLPVAGIQIVGPFPKGLDNTVVLAGGVYGAAKEPQAAKAFLDFLARPAVAPVLERNGMQRPEATAK